MALLGYIKVYNCSDRLLDTKPYYSVKAATLQIESLMADYAGIGAYIIVQPEPYKKRDHEASKQLLQKIIIPSKKVERIKAEYTNLDSPYGIFRKHDNEE